MSTYTDAITKKCAYEGTGDSKMKPRTRPALVRPPRGAKVSSPLQVGTAERGEVLHDRLIRQNTKHHTSELRALLSFDRMRLPK